MVCYTVWWSINHPETVQKAYEREPMINWSELFEHEKRISLLSCGAPSQGFRYMEAFWGSTVTRLTERKPPLSLACLFFLMTRESWHDDIYVFMLSFKVFSSRDFTSKESNCHCLDKKKNSYRGLADHMSLISLYTDVLVILIY